MTSTQPYVRWAEHEPQTASDAPRRAAFIGGEENLLVGRSLEKLLERPPSDDGQLIVYYGPTGVGKSLLVEAIVAAWRKRRPQASILALSAADFARRHSTPAKATPHTLAQSRELATALQTCDLLVLEDLDGLAGRGRPETELRLAIDALLDRGATLVFTAQAAPQKIENLAPGLASRLSGGLAVPVQVPAAAARAEILRVLALRQGLELAPAALAKLAEAASGNALRLNALVAELATSTSATQPLDGAAIESFLQGRQRSRQLDLRLLTRLVAKGFGQTTADLKSSSRKRPIVRARGIAMLLARRYSDYSLERIGKHFGGRDHTTVLHACRKAEEELAAEPAFAQLTERIVAQLASMTLTTSTPH